MSVIEKQYVMGIIVDYRQHNHDPVVSSNILKQQVLLKIFKKVLKGSFVKILEEFPPNLLHIISV